jgi:hypothetical protein
MSRAHRTLAFFGSLWLLAMTAPAAAAAPKMTGTWILDVELDVGSGAVTLVLTQKDDAISGTYTGVLGSDLPVNGKVSDGKVEIWLDSDYGKVTYVGTLENGLFKGTCEYGQVGSGTFTGKKKGE